MHLSLKKLTSAYLLTTPFKRLGFNILGIGIFIAVWQLLIIISVNYEQNTLFVGLTPINTVQTWLAMMQQSDFWFNVSASLSRVLRALMWSAIIAIPCAMVMGKIEWSAKIFYTPMQFLRMISPLSWMPIAVVVYQTWDDAIVFLLIMASIWPILFSTLNGMHKINSNWLLMTQSFHASRLQDLRYVILPAVAQDILTGIRLALGVCWVLIVPAEYLGVTSGLGYAINDARDTLAYDQLGALILTIGFLGFVLDNILKKASHYFQWHQ